MNKFKNILIVAGGTGGHVFPAYSLANFFKTEKKKVHLVTEERGYRYLKDYNINDLIIIIAGIFGGKKFLKHDPLELLKWVK